MGKIYGKITDKYNQPMQEVMDGIMDKNFELQYQTVTNIDGTFCLELPEGEYPFFMAVRDYGEKYLEYWCNNISVQDSVELNFSIDTLEVYGMHVFEICGAAPVLTVYFRPMSLVKALAQEADIAPVITEDSITFKVNGEECKVLVMNQVKEYTQDGMLTAYLVQITRPINIQERNKLDITLRDVDGNMGMGSLYF